MKTLKTKKLMSNKLQKDILLQPCWIVKNIHVSQALLVFFKLRGC